jgi:hypothetical protein
LKETPLTEVELADLEQKGSIEGFVEKIKEKQGKENPTEPVIDSEDEPNPDDLTPFD